MRIDAVTASGLAKDRYSSGISTKGTNVPFRPFQREPLVHKTIVAVEMAFCVDRGMSKESEQSNAIINRNNDHLLGNESGGIIGIAAPACVCAAVNPNHHGQILAFVLPLFPRRIHVQIKAVFV